MYLISKIVSRELLISIVILPTIFCTANAKDLNIGAGLRSSFNMVEAGAPNGIDDSEEFSLDSVRLYLSGELQDGISFTFNTGYEDSTNSVEVLDAIAQFKFSDEFNVWAGRFLPPSDRSNLSGPYYLGAWNFPSAQRYPAVFAGRDEGIAAWGEVDGGKFKYQFGLFNGPDETIAAGTDETLVAGRLTFNFLDAESGYYNSSTYFGGKEVFAVGLVAQSFDSGSGISADILYENPMGSGTLTFEVGAYSYDEFASSDGDGSFILAGWLFNSGWKPLIRFQNTNIDTFNSTTGLVTPVAEQDSTEFELDYIIDGHNARISIVYGQRDINALVVGGVEISPASDSDFIQIGLQLQI